MSVTLRRATIDDSALVLRWRNDPYIVERSSSQRVLTEEEHARWFPGALANPDHFMLIISIDGEEAGLARFDRISPVEAVITAYVLEAFTGRGHGVGAIVAASREAFAHWDISRIVACVREENHPGQRGFAKAGYRSEENLPPCCPAGHHAYILNRSDL